MLVVLLAASDVPRVELVEFTIEVVCAEETSEDDNVKLTLLDGRLVSIPDVELPMSDEVICEVVTTVVLETDGRVKVGEPITVVEGCSVLRTSDVMLEICEVAIPDVLLDSGRTDNSEVLEAGNVNVDEPTTVVVGICVLTPSDVLDPGGVNVEDPITVVLGCCVLTMPDVLVGGPNVDGAVPV